MSAPSRGTGASRARSTTPPTSRGRGARAAASRSFQPRGRGRGAPVAAANPRAEGLLQGLQAGTTARRGPENGTTRGTRGRGTSVRGTSTPSRSQFTNMSKTFNAPKQNSAAPKQPAALASNVDFMAQATTRFETLKRNREAERAKAIKDGFLADPDKKTTLDNAITPVGTCTEMCPAFERVERIVQRMVDKSEKVRNDTARPDEERMVKRFRRSAAGYDEQLPSDIRTPATLRMTLDYLLDDIVGGGERLASVHKFVWDRTRGIRNDFSIQQVTKKEDVSIAVECLERIARFHILSLHQLSNPEHLIGEQFDAHQDREQLNNTLLSLIYYYDDNRHVLEFPNEAEFRAYCIIFELQSQHPDLEDRMQSWPNALLGDGRVKTAFKLYAAAGNNIFDQGPLRPMTSFSLAQGNTGSFWNILASKQVSYLMACVAEIYFGQVRYMALQALWTAATSAPIGTRSKNQDWTLEELANVLGFDAEEQAAGFCEEFGLKISTKDDGVQYLDVSLNKALDKSSIPTKQVFSYGIVEVKRFRRTLTAVINGKTVPQAVREGLVEADESQREGTEEEEPADDGESLFLPEKKPVSANPFAKPAEQASANPFAKPATPSFNLQAPAFAPSMFQQPVNEVGSSASPFSGFGSAKSFLNGPTQASTTPLAKTASLFPATSEPKIDSPTIATKTANPFSKGGDNDFSFTPQSTPPEAEPQPFIFRGGGFAASTIAASVNTSVPATTKPFSFTGFTSQPTSISTTPSEPPTVSWPKPQEGTQSIGAPSTRAQFYAAINDQSNGLSMPHTTAPAGMVSDQQLPQTRDPGTRPPQSLQSNGQTLNTLQHTHPVSQLGFSVESNGPPASSTTPTISFPRAFPQNPSPLVGRSPAEALAQLQNAVVLPSVEISRAAEPSSVTNPATGQANNPIQINDNESGAFAAPTRSGYPWSEPTVPGFRNQTRQAAQPPKPARSAADQQRIVDALAHVMMTQAHGNLMDEYVRLVAPNLINEAIKEHLREVDEQTFRIKNEEYLREKYGRLMANGFRSREVMRKRQRRIAAFAKMELEHEEEERRRRENDEIRAEAARSREIAAQVELNLQKEAEEKAGKEHKREAQIKAAKASQVAGKKRKSDAAQEDDSPETHLDPTGRPYTPRHKRSKTETHVDTDQASDNAYVRHRRRYDRTPQSAGRSLFSRNMSAFNVRLASDPPLLQKLDNTYTDYFRLKARGIDPETPFFPRTAKQEEDRLQQLAEQEARRRAELPPWKGNSTLRNLTLRRSLNGVNPRPMPTFTNSEMSPPARSTPRPAQGPEKRQTAFNSVDDPTTAQPRNKPTHADSIKDLLEKLKNSRQETEDTTDWFKTMRQKLEKEVEQDEQNIRVHQTIERRNSSQTCSSGLMRSEAGYEFVPIDPKPGATLSRAELRIRRTGARGLATKPVGGTPGYVKPAVSYFERSLRYSLNGTGNGEQDVANLDANASGSGVEPSDSDLQPDDLPYANDKGKQRAVEDESANTNPAYPHPGMPTGHGVAFANQEDLDETEEGRLHRLASKDPLQGDGQFTEDEYDADDFEDEEEFDEEEYDDEDRDEELAGPSHRGHYLSATPEVGSRGASSGAHSRAGTSVADAIDLDSD